MSSQVYVHIGLPKTATTTLQLDYFPCVDREKYIYLGVRQPRGQEVADVLFAQIIKSVRTGLGIAEANEKLKERVRLEQRSLIISEELLVVGSDKLSWQEQLGNLSKVLKGVDHQLLVTVREPVSAMFSFYVELYDRFQGKGIPFSELALPDNEFLIFHYDALLKVLYESFDPGDIHVQSFERLVRGDFSAVADFLGRPPMEPTFSSLTNHNQKKKTSSAVLVPQRLELRWVTRLYHFLGGGRNRFTLGIKRIAGKPLKKLRSLTYRSVPVPTLEESERLALSKKMAGSMDMLAERFGVKY